MDVADSEVERIHRGDEPVWTSFEPAKPSMCSRCLIVHTELKEAYVKMKNCPCSAP